MKRLLSLAMALTLALSLSVGAVQGNNQAELSFSPPVSQEEWEVLARTNAARIQNGLRPFSMFNQLHQAARIRATELTEHYRSDHTRPDGSECFSVLEEVSLTDWSKLGENIAKGQRSPEEVVKAWLNSKGHRENILDQGFTHMGAGFDGISSWEQFFLGACSPEVTGVRSAQASCVVGTSVEELRAVLVLTCQHGESYLPVTSELCAGYDSTKLGEQNVVVSYGGQSALMTVQVTGEFGYPFTQQSAAEELYALGLFQGKGTLAGGSPNFDLATACTRQEALVMLLRLLGQEEKVTDRDASSHSFTDVDKWASPYVGYAYRTGITQGTSATAFQGKTPVTPAQGLTFLLRALGYESGADFDWNAPWMLSDQIGLTKGQYSAENGGESLTRGEMALLCRAGLDCQMAAGGRTLRQSLSAQGVISG